MNPAFRLKHRKYKGNVLGDRKPHLNFDNPSPSGLERRNELLYSAALVYVYPQHRPFILPLGRPESRHATSLTAALQRLFAGVL